MSDFVWAALTIVVLTWLYLWRRKRFSLFKEMGIPGPTPSLFSGNLTELIEKSVRWGEGESGGEDTCLPSSVCSDKVDVCYVDSGVYSRVRG
ncbi:cytochrome P450 3A4 [Ixodes scapularis]